MGYRVDYDKMNDILAVWSETYHVYAPAWDQRKKKVRYREIKTVDQIVLDRQADFSPKEAYYPVSQTMFYFTDTEVTESELADDKGIIVIARPCDINGMARLDCIFMENGFLFLPREFQFFNVFGFVTGTAPGTVASKQNTIGSVLFAEAKKLFRMAEVGGHSGIQPYVF